MIILAFLHIFILGAIGVNGNDVRTETSVTVIEGTTATFPCKYDERVYAVYWKKGTTPQDAEYVVYIDMHFNEGERKGKGYETGRFNVTDDYSLLIKSVREDDAGRYFCEVSDLSSGTIYRNHTDVKVEGIAALPVSATELDCQFTTIKVTWEKPEGYVTGYRITCFPKGDVGLNEQIQEKLSSDGLSALFRNLIVDTEYVIRIYTRLNGRDVGLVEMEDRTRPPLPVAKVKLDCHLDAIDVSWVKPDKDATGYRITCVQTEGGITVKEVTVSDVSATLDGLAQDTEYDIYIITLVHGVEVGRIIVHDRTKSLAVLNAKMDCQFTTITVNWEKPHGNVTEYRITCLTKGDLRNREKRQEKLASDELSALFQGLMMDTEYVIRIYTRLNGRDVGLVEMEDRTRPPLPVAKINLDRHLDAIVISWEKPDGDVTGFRIICVLTEADSVVKDLKVSDVYAKLDGLMEDTGYDIDIYTLVHGEEAGMITLHDRTLSKVEHVKKEILDFRVEGGAKLNIGYFSDNENLSSTLMNIMASSLKDIQITSPVKHHPDSKQLRFETEELTSCVQVLDKRVGDYKKQSAENVISVIVDELIHCPVLIFNLRQKLIDEKDFEEVSQFSQSVSKKVKKHYRHNVMVVLIHDDDSIGGTESLSKILSGKKAVIPQENIWSLNVKMCETESCLVFIKKCLDIGHHNFSARQKKLSKK